MSQTRLEKAEIIAEFICRLLKYYREPALEDETMDMYIHDLMDLDLSLLKKAIEIYRKNPKNFKFPLPSQLKALVQVPDEQQARDAVARIIYALHNYGDAYGHTDDKTEKAKTHIGPLGWEVVHRMGGWAKLSAAGYDEIGPTAQAQWRELAVSLRHKCKLGILDEVPSLGVEKKEIGQLESLEDFSKSLVNQKQ